MTSPLTTERVRFPSGTDILVGDLHRPVDAPDTGPAVVVTGSWTTVKEQMAGLYARRLAAEGLTALTFDFTGYGQSQGIIRDLEDPNQKAADINAAVGFLTTLDGVDAERIGAVAICASSGYTAVNAARDPRVASMALVAPRLHDPELVQPYYGGDDGVTTRIQAGQAARAAYEATGRVDYVPRRVGHRRDRGDVWAVGLLPQPRPWSHPGVGRTVRGDGLARLADLRPHPCRRPDHAAGADRAQPPRCRPRRHRTVLRAPSRAQGHHVDRR
ncbi:hypothetical protein BH24ACT15_BH24ACT15_03850 [soil metagenome]